jgi:hypothetical protein
MRLINIKYKPMKPVIIVANVNAIDRRKLENLEGCVFTKGAEIKETLFNLNADFDGIDILDISDYMDAVNNQELDDLSNSWISYVFLK